MTSEQLADIRDRKVPITGRMAIVLADTLLNVLAECDKIGPTEDEQGPGSSFVLGYRTKSRVIAARIGEVELP